MKRLTFRNVYLIILFLTTFGLPLHAQQDNSQPCRTQTDEPQYQIAACDWMMLKRQKLGEFKLTHEIGADGVEVDMGALGKRVLFDNQLRDTVQARKFQAAAWEYNVRVPSMAMSGFFAQSFVGRANYQDLLKDCFQTMRLFDSKLAFLPLGGSGDGWKKAGAARDTLIARLRIAGEMAAKEGITIALRTQQDAKADVKLLKAVGSPNVKIYYNLQDAADNHRDICKELRLLCRHHLLAQIHASNTDSVNLREDPDLDLPKIKKVLDKQGWHGWLVVERSRDITRVRDVKYNFSRNVAYLKEIFRPKR